MNFPAHCIAPPRSHDRLEEDEEGAWKGSVLTYFAQQASAEILPLGTEDTWVKNLMDVCRTFDHPQMTPLLMRLLYDFELALLWNGVDIVYVSQSDQFCSQGFDFVILTPYNAMSAWEFNSFLFLAQFEKKIHMKCSWTPLVKQKNCICLKKMY